MAGKSWKYCLCEFAPLLLIGILGTIVISTIILAITVGATALGILIAVFSFFFTLAIIQFFLFGKLLFLEEKNNNRFKD